MNNFRPENARALILSYLSSRQQRVKLLNVKSEWACLQKGVPQGSILGPLIFNVFMNDIYLSIVNTNLYNYADDNSMAAIGRTKLEVIQCLKLDAEIAIQWFKDNKMEANPSKFQYTMLNSSNEAPLVIENINIEPEQYVRLLGVYIDSNLNFTYHVDNLCKKASNQIRVLKRLSCNLDQVSRMQIFRSFILSHFKYCAIVYHF